MMEKLALLIVLLASLANGELDFGTNMYRDRVTMKCFAKGSSSSYLNYVSTVITMPTGYGDTYVASISRYRTVNNFTDASISYDENSANNSLTLIWYSPNAMEDGIYTCTIYYLADDNTPREESKQINAKLADMDPDITAVPGNILDGLTKSLTVECSSITLTTHGLSLPAQIDIFHIHDGKEQLIASAATNDSDKFESTAKNGWEIVSSNIAKDQALNLVAIWELPTTRESGTYKCILSGTNNETDKVVQVVKTMQVTVAAATKQDVYDRVGEEDQKDYFLSTCNFENGLCGFNVSNSDPGWQHVQSRLVGDIADHTSGNALGHFLYVQLRERSYLVATLRSKEFLAIGRSLCVSFCYYITGSYTELSVYIARNSTSSSYPVYTATGSYGWQYALLSVRENSEPFTVELQFRDRYSSYYYYNTYFSGFAIVDDFVVSDINCNPF